jgi:mannose-6-phosphate isomerase-like protein (cupin superfamily)
MKIYRPEGGRNELRPGYTLGILAEVLLQKEVSSIGFFRPNIPPQGKLRNHYHENLIEFMFFLQPSQIKIGEEIFPISPGDMVSIFPGESHEILAGPEGSSPLVIKVPNAPSDIKYPE